MSRVAEYLVLLYMLSAATAHSASSDSVAAHVDGEPITIETVDAMSPGQAQRIDAHLSRVARATLERLVDERLGIDDLPEPERVERRKALYSKHDVALASLDPKALENPLPPDQVVGVVDGTPLLAATLERAAALRLYRLRGELYLQRRRDLDRLLERRLIEIEAQSRGVSLQTLERSLAQAQDVSDAEVEAFIASERAAGRNVDDPERARPYLEFQQRYQRRTNVLNARRAKTPISIELAAPMRPRLAMDLRGGVNLGARDGRHLVVYTNYTCTLCRKTHAELDRLLAMPNPPSVVLHDFASDPVAMQAAALVRCAARNGRAAQMRTHLLSDSSPRTNEASFDPHELQAFAQVAGMKPKALRTCTESREVRQSIERDTRSAIRLGFDDPPAFIAEGVPLSGMQSAGALRDALMGRGDALR